MWSFLKKKIPKITHGVPTGKKDRNGKIITNHLGLKKLYLETYLHRLRNRPIKPDFEELKYLKDNLFDMKLENSRKRKSKPWEMADLEKVLKNLKKDKARDPNGWINDIFKEGVAGKDLKVSML